METETSATRKQWIAVLGGLLGAFMAVLDVSITNASLQDIQGGLNATLDEGAWISTAYLVAEIIVIPLTAFFARVFGIKRYLRWNAALFLFASILCGMARSLPTMIAARALQGMAGGVLIPIAVTLILTKLPKSRQPLGLALFSLAATFAPSIGPTIGGWLTVNYSWQWIFFLNFIPGIALIALISYGLDDSPLQLGLLKQGDWFGIATMGLALGSLTVVLEDGVREDWWGSKRIVALTITAVVSFLVFLYHELRTPHPFINLRLFMRRNFFIASVLAMIFGVGLYGSIFILPFFLASVRHYDAQQIGQVIMWQGLPQLFILPFVPKLMSKIDTRGMLAFGFLLFGASAVMNSHLTADWGFDQFFWSQVVRALGGPFIITPLSTIAYVGIEPAEIGSASGLNNMLRNLGGSIGIGSLGAFFNHQYHLHFTRLTEATGKYSYVVQTQITQRSNLLSARNAAGSFARQSLATIYQTINREADVMAFGDSFLWIGILFFVGTALLIFARKPNSGIKAAEGSH